MKSIEKQLIEAAIDSAAVPKGFRRKGSAWYLETPESILVLEPQRSAFAAQYYLNMGVYYRALGSDVKPRERHCHLRNRISELLPAADRHALECALIFDGKNSDDRERANRISAAIVDYAIPALLRYAVLENVRSASLAGELRGFLVSKEMSAALN